MNLWHHISVLVWLIAISAFECSGATQKYKEQFAIEGSSYKMKCPDLAKESSPMPYIVWSVNGLPPRGQKYKLLDDGLVIRNVSKEDTFANYTCTALERQTFLPVNSEKIQLKLSIRQRGGKSLETSSSTTPTENKVKIWVWGIVNQWKTLQCRVISRPSPTFTWRSQKSGEIINNSPDLYKIVQDDSTSNLTIFLHNETLFGEYSCIASNIHGESTQNFILAEGYKPKTPFMFPTFIGKGKITVKVQPQDDPKRSSDLTDAILPVKHYFVQYVKADSLKNNDETENGNAGPVTNANSKYRGEYRKKWTTVSKTIEAKEANPHITEIFELGDLEGNTTYLVRSAVANAAAISDFSLAIRITTDSLPRNDTSMVDNKSEDQDEMQSDGKGREEHGRSTDNDAIINGSTSSNSTSKDGDRIEDGSCGVQKFRKTVTITTTTTTLIESYDDSGNKIDGDSSLVKKRVEEDTTVERINLCSFN